MDPYFFKGFQARRKILLLLSSHAQEQRVADSCPKSVCVAQLDGDAVRVQNDAGAATETPVPAHLHFGDNDLERAWHIDAKQSPAGECNPGIEHDLHGVVGAGCQVPDVADQSCRHRCNAQSRIRGHGSLRRLAKLLCLSIPPHPESSCAWRPQPEPERDRIHSNLAGRHQPDGLAHLLKTSHGARKSEIGKKYKK